MFGKRNYLKYLLAAVTLISAAPLQDIVQLFESRNEGARMQSAGGHVERVAAMKSVDESGILNIRVGLRVSSYNLVRGTCLC